MKLRPRQGDGEGPVQVADAAAVSHTLCNELVILLAVVQVNGHVLAPCSQDPRSSWGTVLDLRHLSMGEIDVVD